MNASVLTIGQSRVGNVCIVTLAGRIDSTNANDLQTALTRLFGSGEKSVLVDLGAVLYLTSAAFRALLVAVDEAERNGATLALCSVAGHVRDLFEMGGLDGVFTIHGSQDEALKQFA